MARIDGEKLGEMLSGYIDGELDPLERQIIERVLREDESARQLLADLRRTAGAVSSLPRHAAPSSILGDTQATLERSALLDDFPIPRPHQTRGRSSWAARLAMAAMVGLVLVTGWWFTAEQSRRNSKNKIELAQREPRDADAARDENKAKIGFEKSGAKLATRSKDISAPIGIDDAVGWKGGAVATVEEQLAAGADPMLFRSQNFAAEPVRLQVTVRDRTERETVATKIASALSTQRLANLESAVGPRIATTGSTQNFYYRGKSGVNFDASNEEQILVRASPGQIDHLLSELSEPEEAVALVAGPITVRGVEKSRSVVQLLSNQGQADLSKSTTKLNEGQLFDNNRATAETGRALAVKPTAQNGGLIDGFLRIVGVDPKLVSTGAQSAAEPGVPPLESRQEAASVGSTRNTGDETNMADTEEIGTSLEAESNKTSASATTALPAQPAAPSALVDRRFKAAQSAKRVDQTPSADATLAEAEAPVTMIIQIIESPRPVQPPQPVKTRPDPPVSRKVAE